MNEDEIAELRRKLLGYPGATAESVERQIEIYEERIEEKEGLMASRGMSNRMAEHFLERKGWPRPPGWHSVFFVPGSNIPRTGYILFGVIAVAAIWFFLR